MKYWLFLLLALGLAACSRAQNPSSPQTAPHAQAVSQTHGTSHYPAPIQALVNAGLVIQGSLPAPPGYTGYLASDGSHSIPIYLLPDHKYAVVGTLFDATGQDLTAEPLQAASRPTLNDAVWARLATSTWIAEGAEHPKRIAYMFLDTECPFCHKQWQAMQPLLKGSDVQVRYVIVAVIAPQSAGRGAAVLSARDPLAALRENELAFGHSPIVPLKSIPARLAKRLQDNNALMNSLGITGTPGTVFKDAQGQIRLVVGAIPPDRLKTILDP